MSEGETISLATSLSGLEVPEVEVFEGADLLEAWKKMNATFLERGWGDGFPLAPATPGDVSSMLAGTRRSPDEVVAVLEPSFGMATVEKIAINAVMAGCKPEQLPVLIAAVEAISDPQYDLRHVASSTGAYTPCLVVNGPIAKRIGMNSGMACLGPGAPSAVNTAIGRAVRLIMMNIGGDYVGINDPDVIGDSNKYSMCLAEKEEANPWEPLHVERGYDKNDSTVTVFVANSTIHHVDYGNFEPVGFLRKLSKSICIPGVTASAKWLGRPHKDTNTRDLKPEDYHQDCLIILAPNHAEMLGASGWSKVGLKTVLHHFCKLPIGEAPGSRGDTIKRYAAGESQRIRPEWGWLHDHHDEEISIYPSLDSFHFVVAGGDAPKSLVVLGGRKSITRRIEE